MSEMKLETSHISCMVQLIEEGPLHKDEISDRLARDELLSAGYLSKIVFGGEDGFIAATYAGQQLYCKKIVGVAILRNAVKERQRRGVISKCAK